MVKANLIFFLPEGGFKTNFNKKVGGPRQINFSVYNLRSEYIFSNGRVRQEGG